MGTPVIHQNTEATPTMKPKKRDDQYPDEQVQRRFEAALRGARKVGHKPMKSLPRRRVGDNSREKTG
ncbi:MAG: hypothetical protein ACREDD_06445 [Methylocella sp.]